MTESPLIAPEVDPGAVCDAALNEKIESLDALAAILPALAGPERTDQLAALLGEEDIATLRHLASEGIGENSLKALTSDCSYLEGWCVAATGEHLPWPAPVPLILKFIAHHLWDPDKKRSDPSHGMPEDVAGTLKHKNPPIGDDRAGFLFHRVEMSDLEPRTDSSGLNRSGFAGDHLV